MAKPTQKQNQRILVGTQKGRETLWKAVEKIQDRWGLKPAEMARLLHAKGPTFHSWKSEQEIPVSEPLTPVMEVVIAVIAIHRSLSAMFSEPKDQLAWLRAKHPAFSDAPIDHAIKSTANLFVVRSYLDYVRGLGA